MKGILKPEILSGPQVTTKEPSSIQESEIVKAEGRFKTLLPLPEKSQKGMYSLFGAEVRDFEE